MWESKAYGNSQGGFMNKSTVQSPAQKPKTGSRTQNIIPMCIRQILQCSDEGLKIASYDVHMLTMVVLVRGIEVESTKVTYRLDDGSGEIDGIFWLDAADNETSRNLPDIVENMYCRIFGSMRTSHGKKHVFVFKIRKLSSLNDLTRHLLEVIHCPLKLEIMARKDSAKEAEKDISDASMSNSFMSSSVRNATGFNTQQELVYNAIIKSRKDIGAHVREIEKEVAGRVTPKQVETILEFLCSEGHIYSTVDDEHYRSTDS